MTTLQDVLSLSMLSSFIWTVWFLIPKALNGRNRFGAICSILTALIALIGWLLLGTPLRSR